MADLGCKNLSCPNPRSGRFVPGVHAPGIVELVADTAASRWPCGQDATSSRPADAVRLAVEAELKEDAVARRVSAVHLSVAPAARHAAEPAAQRDAARPAVLAPEPERAPLAAGAPVPDGEPARLAAAAVRVAAPGPPGAAGHA